MPHISVLQPVYPPAPAAIPAPWPRTFTRAGQQLSFPCCLIWLLLLLHHPMLSSGAVRYCCGRYRQHVPKVAFPTHSRHSCTCSRAMLYNTVSRMQTVYGPCMSLAPRRPSYWQPFSSRCASTYAQQLRSRQGACACAQQSRPQQAQLQITNHKQCVGVVASLLAVSGPSRAGEVSEAAADAATATTAAATNDIGPTVTFGGSFGQYDPIIAVFFYAVVAALLVLTLGVSQ